MWKRLGKDKWLFFVLLLALSIRLFSLNEQAVERYYSGLFYPPVSEALRFLFGWIPFSVGDVLYASAVLYLVYKSIFLFKRKARLKNKDWWKAAAKKALKRVVLIYIIFNVFWGINYNRIGIAGQLSLSVEPYEKEDLMALCAVLQDRLCVLGDSVGGKSRIKLDKNRELFIEGAALFGEAKKSHPYFKYRFPSVKASLLTPLGSYFGFTGYYNPFTAEAQLKTSVPPFIKPFVLCHEIAHQLGYAKENEANLVSFLVAKNAANPEFRYSVYFDMYAYALAELAEENKREAFLFLETAHPRLIADRKTYRDYVLGEQNSVEPYVSSFYDRFLKLNNQPGGKQTYNQVVGWLVAYQKKMGSKAL